MDKIANNTIGRSSLSAAAVQEEVKAQEAKRLLAKDVKTKAEIEKASGGFESLLLNQMLKEMWNTVNSTGLMGENSHESQIYRDMLNQSLADSIAEGKGIGIKDFLKKEMLKEQHRASNSSDRIGQPGNQQLPEE